MNWFRIVAISPSSALTMICKKGEEWMRSVETAAASREDVRLSKPDFFEISL